MNVMIYTGNCNKSIFTFRPFLITDITDFNITDFGLMRKFLDQTHNGYFTLIVQIGVYNLLM
jgi:hypothetical protein